MELLSGQQVKYYSLAVEEVTFALQVLQYRQEQRIKREERKRQQQEENRLYRVMIETQYGITSNSISTPDQNNSFTKSQQGVNMAKSQLSSALEKTLPVIELLKTIGKGLELVIGLGDGVSCPNWIRKLLIDWLKYSTKSLLHDLKET